MKLTLEQNIFLAKKLLVGSIYSAAKIENINVTFPETQAILDGINVGRLPINDIEKILNLRDAWHFALNHIHTPLNLDFITKINGYVARNESLDWGVLRYGAVGISGTEYIPPIPTEEVSKKNIQKIIEHLQNPEDTIDLFLYLCRSQLFWDGNKRTAMIATNVLLIQNGLGIFQIKDTDMITFNGLLTEFYDTNIADSIKRFLSSKALETMDIQDPITP